MKTADCIKCDFFEDGTYVQPGVNQHISEAENIVIIDSPSRHDARDGYLLARDAGVLFFDALSACMDSPENVHVTSAVRCNMSKKKAKSPTARRCYNQFLKKEIDDILLADKPVTILLVGFWPVRLVLGKDLNELGTHVIHHGNVKFGVVRCPQSIIDKYVRWTKDEYGRWTCPEGSQEKAKLEWNQHAIPVFQQLYSSGYADITAGQSFRFHYTKATEEQVINALTKRKGAHVSFDVETMPNDFAQEKKWTALDWFYGSDTCQVRCAAFTLFDSLNDAGYVPGTKPKYSPQDILVMEGNPSERLANALSDMKVIAFNASYDTGVIYAHTGVRLPIHTDPCDMAYVVDQTRKRYNLSSLVYQYLPEVAGYDSELSGKNYSTIELEKLMPYNAGDVWCSYVLCCIFAKKIREMKAHNLYWKILARVKPYLRDMEARGVTINRKRYAEIAVDLNEECETLLKELQDEAAPYMAPGKVFNPRSPAQLKNILTEILGYEPESTRKEVLDKLHDQTDSKFIDNLINYRTANKVHSIYVKGLGERIHKGVVYPSFKLNTTATGRTSSGGGDTVGLGRTKQINIQNVPRDGDLRSLFMARRGHYLAYYDYSQIEVRVAGAYARSQEIADICRSDSDFHGMMASKAFRKDYQWIMDEDAEKSKDGGTSFRTKGKSVTFGILYGMQSQGLAAKLNMYREDGTLDIDQSQSLIDDYFVGLPSVKEFIDRVHAFVIKNMYVQTAFGRVRRFEEAGTSSLREGVNTLIQSVASDIFLCATTSLGDEFKRRGWYWNTVFPWAEVHDAGTWEVSNEIPQEEIQAVMEECLTVKLREDFPFIDTFLGDIPLNVDFKFDNVWH